jgi:hypothetical protein
MAFNSLVSIYRSWQHMCDVLMLYHILLFHAAWVHGHVHVAPLTIVRGGRGGIKGFAFHVHVSQHVMYVIIIPALCSCTWYNGSLYGTTVFPRTRLWWRVILVVFSHDLWQELNCCYIKYVLCSSNSGADGFLRVLAIGVLFFCLHLYYCLVSYTHYIHV